MIAIIDYGVGNLRSVEKAFLALGAEVKVTRDPAEALAADGVVLPGVGAFEVGMKNLQHSQMDKVVIDCFNNQKPLFGICLGMQLLFEYSEETNHGISSGTKLGLTEGLGLIKGTVRKFEAKDGLKIPQMGWNSVKYAPESRLFHGLDQNEYFYFVHSYYCDPNSSKDSAGLTEYGCTYSSAIEAGQLFATQFHPEKSGLVGLKLLKNFISLSEGKA